MPKFKLKASSIVKLAYYREVLTIDEAYSFTTKRERADPSHESPEINETTCTARKKKPAASSQDKDENV